MAYASATTGSIVPILSRKARVRLCTRCLNPKGNDGMKWCSACRVITALAHKFYRHDHIKRKLCTECAEKHYYSPFRRRHLRMCATHREYHNEWHRERNAERRAAGQCAQCGTRSQDAYRCDDCIVKNAARKALTNGTPSRIRKAA